MAEVTNCQLCGTSPGIKLAEYSIIYVVKKEKKKEREREGERGKKRKTKVCIFNQTEKSIVNDGKACSESHFQFKFIQLCSLQKKKIQS